MRRHPNPASFSRITFVSGLAVAISVVLIAAFATSNPSNRGDQNKGPSAAQVGFLAVEQDPPSAGPGALITARVFGEAEVSKPAFDCSVDPRCRKSEPEMDLDRYMPGGGEVEDLESLEADWHNRLTYPTGIFNPAWLRNALAQHELIPISIPGGLVPKLNSTTSSVSDATSASTLSSTSFTALGPQPLRMTGCSGCYNYSVTSGRVNDIAIDPVTTNVAYVATVGGGVWKTSNCCSSDTTWRVVTDNPLLSMIGIDTVTIDPNNHNTIYAGTGDLNYGSFSMGSQGILKSTDAGETWTLLGEEVFGPALPLPAGRFPQYQAVGKVRVDPNNSNNVVAGTKTGLYLSYDGGNNWTGPCTTNNYSEMRQDITGLALSDMGGTTRIIAAIGVRGFSTTVQYNLNQNGANGIYKAAMPSSGCPSFTSITTNQNGWTGLNATSGNAYVNATTGNQVGRVDIAVAPSDPNYIYAQVQSITPNSNSGCANANGCQLAAYRTTDGGNTWTQIPGSTGAALRNCGGSAGDYPQNWYDQGVAVDPNNPNRVFFDTYEIWFWQDGSTTWNDLTCGYSGSVQVVHVDQHALAFVPGSSSILLAGNDGGVHGTLNAHVTSASVKPTWFNMDKGFNTIEFYSGDISGNFANSPNPQANGGSQDNGSMSVTFNGTPTGPVQWQMGKGGDGFYGRIDPVGGRFWQGNNSGHLNFCTSNCTASGATWNDSGSPWSNPALPDVQSFILPYEIYKGIPGDPLNDCPPTGCGHLIVGTVRVWETITGNSAAAFYLNSPDNLTKQTLGNRSFINQLAFAPADQSTAMVGTNDGNVQIAFGMGTGSATATWVNVTGGNVALPNRPILDVTFDPTTKTAPIAYAAVGGFNANTPTTPGHVFQVTCTERCGSYVWVDKTGNLPDIPVASIIANPNYPQQVFAGTDWGLYFTDDINAASPVWARFENGIPHAMIWDMQIDRGATTLSVWTRGRGAYVWPLPFASEPSPTPTPTPTATPTPTPSPSPTEPVSGDGPHVFQGTYDPEPYPCATQRQSFNVASGKSRILVQVNAQIPTNDISVSLLYGSGANPVLVAGPQDPGTCCEALLYEPVGGVPAGTYQVQVCQTPTPQGVPQTAPYNYTGTFTVDGTGATPSPSPSPSPLPTPVPVYEKGGITFAPNVALRAPVATKDGEPSLRVDKLGNAYVAGIRGVPAGVDLWYFDLNPSSPNYDPFMRNPIYRGQPDQISPDESFEVGGDGGGDVDLAVGFGEASPGNPPYLAFTSLAAANISAARSTDRGTTFTKNPAGNVTGGIPADDRQWMEFYGSNSVYLIYRTLSPVIAWVQRSNDGGLTYGPARQVGSIGQVGGVSVDQTDGTVYISGGNGVVAVGRPATPGAEPLTYTIHNVAGTGKNHIFFTVKAARDGTVYVCYSDGKTVFIRYSKDKGYNWSQAIRVSDGPETATSILPWMETGPLPGSIGVVWYGTTDTTNNDNANWKVFFAQSINATDANPVFRQVELSDHFIHGSNISEEGLPIIPGGAPNRNLLDYFQIGFDPTGAAVVAYTDDHNDFDGHVYVSRQISGRGVGGTDIPAPVEGASLPALQTGGPNDPQVIDFAQDHRNGLLTVLPVNDPLDILSVKYSLEGTQASPVLVATMKVSDLTVVPPLSNWRMNFTANAPDSRISPLGDYSFGLSDRGDQFFVRATTDAAGIQTYTYGTAVREHQHRGMIAYTDRGAADSGSFNSAAGTITIKISLSKLNATLASGRTPIGAGSILAGLRGGAYTTGDDNALDRNDRAKSDITRGGTQFVINSAPVAALSADPTSGTAPLDVNFDASDSADPDAGDRLSYTFDFGDGSEPFTQDSPLVIHQYSNPGTFTASVKVKDSLGWGSNTASVTITVNSSQPPINVCYEDDDSHIAYSSGWHSVSSSSASAGHFALHNGKEATHFGRLTFDVPAGQTGAITYTYARSTKGGSAQVYIDGVSKGVINYKGVNGGMRDPEFSTSYTVRYDGITPGQHTFELRNMTESVYIDSICLETASSSAHPASGPGATSSSSGTVNAGQTSSNSLTVPTNATAISVLAEASGGLPIKLVLVDPKGLTLKTVDSTNGVAVLTAPVTQGGLYTVKVVNVSLGPLQVSTLVTPTLNR